MPLFVYADESGVFDSANNDFFVFGGVIFRSRNERDNVRRKYIAAERAIRAKEKATVHGELKACVLNPKDKSSLFRSLNKVERFAVVVNQKSLSSSIFDHKKNKQRYLDYAFKIGLKRALEGMIEDEVIDATYSECLHVFMDEHTTATNGRYELREALECEFKIGTHNYNWNRFHPPILPKLENVEFTMRDSQSDPLIRAADIVANKAYFHSRSGRLAEIDERIRYIVLP